MRSGYIPAQEYRIAMPYDTHWGPATCEDIGCTAFLNGWKTVLPVGHDLIATLKRSGRTYREEPEDGGLVAFIFPAGQPCFQASTHRKQLDRPGLLIHRNREEPGRGRVVTESEWIERNMETLDGLRKLREE